MASSADKTLPLVRHCYLRRFLFWFAAIVLWRRLRPNQCISAGRPPIVPVPRNSKLYFRFFCNNANPSGLPTKAGIPCPDQSVNCNEADGRAWFLLLPEPQQSLRQHHRARCSGIVELRRNAFPMSFNAGGVDYVADIEHAPAPHNYQHCEVRVYANGLRVDLERAKLLERKQYEQLVSVYRQLISKQITLILWPNSCTQPEDWNAKSLSKTACAHKCPRG